MIIYVRYQLFNTTEKLSGTLSLDITLPRDEWKYLPGGKEI